MPKTDNFYNQLPAFKEFEEFVQHSHYRQLTEDWIVFIADIKNSTQAIEHGKYKEVNLIGAASITLTIQALNKLEFPFVFGGDGASLCIPPEYSELVCTELAKLIRFAEDNYSLHLRIAKIPVSEIYQAGKELLVSKLEITPGKHIALFRGGGLDYADRLAKQTKQLFSVEKHRDTVIELKGLSCRWSPIKAEKGLIISLLVVARGDNISSVYQAVLSTIRSILDCSIEDANPINLEKQPYKNFWTALKDERKYHSKLFSFNFFKRIVDIFLTVLIFKYNVNPLFFLLDAKTYKQSINKHSDYRKFDDTMRLIVDCRNDDYEKLNRALETAYLNGEIYYGLFASKEALMTCFVESTQQGEHLHFIDGGDGGLAMAAKQLKSQIKLSTS